MYVNSSNNTKEEQVMDTSRRYMMATVAHHQLGDISSDRPTLCDIDSEDEENYIGNWVDGFGFVEVKFPKATTRELTDDEKNFHNGRILMMGTQLAGIIQIPDAPNIVPISDRPMVVHTHNSIYRLGQANKKGVRAIIKDGGTLSFDWCVVKSLMLHRPLVLMGLHGENPVIPFVSSTVEYIDPIPEVSV